MCEWCNLFPKFCNTYRYNKAIFTQLILNTNKLPTAAFTEKRNKQNERRNEIRANQPEKELQLEIENKELKMKERELNSDSEKPPKKKKKSL